MPIDVIFPRVGLEETAGRIARWLVGEGDLVRKGQVLFEIDDDKAAVEVEAPGDGIVRGLAPAGAEVTAGASVARIFDRDEAGGGAVAAVTPTGLAAPTPPAGDPPAPPAARTMAGKRPPNPTPLARRIARERGVDLAGVVGTGPGGRVQKRDVPERPTIGPAWTDAAAARLHAVWLQRGAGTPLVLLHGFASDHNSWRGLHAGAPAPAPVLALDLPAHGASPRRVPDDLDGIAAAVEATLRSEGVDRAVLAGHSFGAAVATRLAARGVVDVRALCLFAPAGLDPRIDGAFVDGVVAASTADALRPWLEMLVDDPATMSDAYVEAAARQRRTPDLGPALRAFADRFFPGGAQAFSVRADLARLAVPVRVVAGRNDRILAFSSTARLPGHVALHALDRCGHLPQFEAPGLSRQILAELVRLA